MLKKQMNKRIYILVYLIIVIQIIQAQEEFNLRQLIDRALIENYQVRIVNEREQIADNNNTLGNAGFLPKVTLDGEQSFSTEDSRSEYYNDQSRSGSSLNAMFNVDWVVFDGLKMFARKDRLEYLHKTSQLDTRYYLEQTISDIFRIYYNILKENQLLDNFKQSLEISDFRLQLEKRKQEIGTGNTLLYNQALVDYHSDSSRIVNQVMIIKNLYTRLNQILNLPPETKILVQEVSRLKYQLPGKDSLVTAAISSNIELRQAQVAELIAETNRRIEAGDRYPEVSIFGNYFFSRSSGEQELIESQGSFGPQYGVSVRFKLYDGGKESLQLRNAEIEENISSLDKERISLNILTTLLERWNQHQSFMQQLELSRQSMSAAEKSLSIARQQLEAGAINGYDFRLTQRSYLQVKSRVVEMNYLIKEAEIDLLRISGNLMNEVW